MIFKDFVDLHKENWIMLVFMIASADIFWCVPIISGIWMYLLTYFYATKILL